MKSWPGTALTLWSFGLLSVALPATSSEILARQTPQITNLRENETLEYPVALLRGTVDNQADQVQIIDRDNPDNRDQTRVPVVKGQFVAVIELVPGRNHLTLSAGDTQASLTLTYRRIKPEHYVNVIYLSASDGGTRYLTQLPEDPQDYLQKLDTALKLMQTLTAERLNDIGLGRKTFALNFDAKGKVIVHTLRYPETAASLQTRDGNQLYQLFYPWVTQQFPQTAQNVVIMAFTRYDPATRQIKAHTALGAPGMGLFSCNGMCAWPRSIADVPRAFSDTTPVDNAQIYDDSGARSVFWGLAATTMGAILHEMGHTFGLAHVKDPESIMSRGFEHFNRVFTIIEPPALHGDAPTPFTLNQTAYWDKESATKLLESPWFQASPPVPIQDSH